MFINQRNEDVFLTHLYKWLVFNKNFDRRKTIDHCPVQGVVFILLNSIYLCQEIHHASRDTNLIITTIVCKSLFGLLCFTERFILCKLFVFLFNQLAYVTIKTPSQFLADY